MRLNNKGQSLVLFVLLVPLFMIVIASVIDIGNIVFDKISLSNTNRLAINYYLNNVDSCNESDIYNLIGLNDRNISDIDININDGTISIILYKYSGVMFKKLFRYDGFYLKSYYRGYVSEDENIVIEEVD